MRGGAARVAAFAAGASRVEFSIAGDVLACPDMTYTVQLGSIKEVMREGVSASGNQMFSVIDVPQHVVLVGPIRVSLAPPARLSAVPAVTVTRLIAVGSVRLKRALRCMEGPGVALLAPDLISPDHRPG